MKKKVLEYRNVEIKLDSDLKILGLTLIINEGEFVFLIGKTGSGKSSILKSMYSENKILNGEAKISNTNLKTITEKNIPFLRRKIGVIFQDFQLLKDRTVYKNLEFVLNATGWSKQNEKKDRIESCLQKVHISDLSNKYPSQLSGGQKQKVAIARSLLNQPEIIIADDGPGLPENKMNSVFARGFRLDEQTPGTGLGLNIVKDLVEMCKGSVCLAKSKELGGLEVKIILPLSKA